MARVLLDPNDPASAEADTSTADPTPAPAAPAAPAANAPNFGGGAPGFDLNAFYMGNEGLGRAPSQTEFDTDTHTINSYGVDAFKQDFQKRRAPTDYRTVDSQSAQGQAQYGSGTNNGSSNGAAVPQFRPAAVPVRANTSPQFTDPSQQLVESTALNRLQQLNNPDPNSGQGLYENFAKQLLDYFQQAPYSAADDAALKAQAFNSLEQDRSATHQRFMEELSRRRIPPSSGIALDGFKHIDNHYDQLRAGVENQLAVKAIDLNRANKLQGLDIAGGLAGTQNARLNQALDVSRIPYNLGTDSFNQNLQAVNAGGNPSQNVATAIQLATAVSNAQNLSSSQRAAYLQQIFTFLGGL